MAWYRAKRAATTAREQTKTDTERMLSSEEVLRAEAHQIHAGKLKRLKLDLEDRKGAALYQALNQLDSAALCLSGGGIRSAAFCLGVIQALASQPRSAPTGNDKPGPACDEAQRCLLSKFHYLSTVSGGGYIGSWLSAWRSHAPWNDVWRGLISRPPGTDQEPPALDWLRSYSNYLTPKMGLMSADTWAATALFVRNLVLNWIVIIPMFCVVILLLKLIAVFSDWATIAEKPVSQLLALFPIPAGWAASADTPVPLPYTQVTVLPFQIAFAAGAILCLILALSFIVKSRPSQRSATDTGPGQRQFILRALLPAYVSAALLVQFLASDDVGEALLRDDADHVPAYSIGKVILAGAACGMLIYAVSWLVARVRWNPRDFLFWSAAGAIYGSLIALGVYGYIQIPDEGILSIHGKTLFSNYVFHVVFGLPWVFLSQLTADMIFMGLADFHRASDADREWLGRAAGWLMIAAFCWLVLSFTVFFGAILGPEIITTETQAAVRSWATTLAGVFGLITAFLGMSSVTPACGPAKDRTASLTNLALLIAAPLFVLALLIGLSFLLDQLLLRIALVPELFCWWNAEIACWGNHGPSSKTLERLHDLLWLVNLPDPVPSPYLARPEALVWLGAGLIAFAGITVVASLCININRFSLHALYRNRLIRAFLGASRADRKPDKFTDFDQRDNIRICELQLAPQSQDWRPFHLINIALNVVSSKRLAWQERKAESFVVTPLHAGSSYLGFRSSKTYGGPGGITLGTAMAISGAAASPNMGYNSSPAITFLMTMFNVRLGWWLGNPGPQGERTYMRDGPRCAIKPLIDEALGLTTDNSAHVYLSDGGHFENLGLYEAVRRRCRFIIAVDAGCDPHFSFADLGNAMRKIRIDLGVTIRFVQLERLKKRTPDGSILADADYCALGLIDYIAADGQPKEGPPIRDGLILYLKAGYHGTEGGAIRSYANAHPEFPHESTLDQWFSESQFESYRSLGFEIMDDLLSSELEKHDHVFSGDLDVLFEWWWARANPSKAAASGGASSSLPPTFASQPPAQKTTVGAP